MTILAIFGILYAIYNTIKKVFKKKPVETMSQFLESISEVYPLTPQLYELRKRKERV